MYWSKGGAPKELFYSAQARDGQVLMHTKASRLIPPEARSYDVRVGR